VRQKDDLYIQSFVNEVNRLIDQYERLSRFNDEFYHMVLSEISDLIYRLEKEKKCDVQTQKELLLNIHKRLTELRKIYNIKL
ncbi:MAG: hypothetical protein GXO99_08445, partial [Nitrospirae bacterium]|nr:hypothetical protein [Nitrospirota bacterium]